MDLYEELENLKKLHKLTNKDLGAWLGKTGDTFRKSMNRKSVSPLEFKELIRAFDNSGMMSDNEKLFNRTKKFTLEVEKQLLDGLSNHNSIKVNEHTEIYNTKSGNNIEELSNGKYLLTVPMVPYKAHATYLSEFQDAEYISDLKRVSFVVDHVPKGKYRSFEIMNDSMDDSTLDFGPSRKAILPGDIVLGRSLKKEYWREPLRTGKYPFWIIVYKNGITCKEIINHDVENGIITCHSLNSSQEYSDFEIELNDCFELYNIVKKQTE